MTIPPKTHKEQHSKTYSSKMHSSKPRNPKTSMRLALPAFSALRMLAVLLLGSLALALACAPAVEGSGHPPAAVTSITEDETKQESTSFTVRWEAPTSTGTTQDGTPLDSADIGYRIYYLAETAGQTAGQTTDQATPSAESLRQNADTQTKEVKGVLQATITDLTPATRYFVTIASYNAQPSEPVVVTVSSEVIIATTGAATRDLSGSLSYGAEAETTHEFTAGIGGTITPYGTPAIPLADSGSGVTVSYSLEIIDGTDFTSEKLAIDGGGVITIMPTTSAGSARYFVRAEATGYTTQRVVLTITVNKANFEGRLAYASTAYEFPAGTERTIEPEPTGTLSIPSADSSGTIIRYSLTISTGAEFDPMPSINDRGIITVNPSNTTLGTATYIVRADTDTDTYNAQEVMVTIKIVVNPNAGRLQVSTYYSSNATYTIPVGLGQAVDDDSSTFVLANDDVVLTISDLTDGEHRIYFGSSLNNYDDFYTKIATDGVITIIRSELRTNSFSFAFGAVIGISGPGNTVTEHIATYFPSNIYGHHDLQAMRKDLTQNYVLKRDIVFPPPASESASNYKAVGSDSAPFTGSLNGTGLSITGIEIVGTGTGTDNYQGIFKVMEASSIDTKAAQNLTLKDFKITGNAVVGSLAGWIKQGTVDNVHVEVSDADTGKIEVSGSITVDTTNYGYGGGLFGRAGTGATDTQVKIQNTSSAVAVSGTGTNSNTIGGLVGETGSDVVLAESFATGSVMVSLGGITSVGGLVGSSAGMVTGGSYATGLVMVSHGATGVGGLVGSNTGTVTGYATGLVVGSVGPTGVGGLVGDNTGTVIGYATGNMTTSGGYYVGGLVGSNTGTVTGYATGDMTTSAVGVGGLVGSNAGTVTGYAKGDVIGQTNVGGLVGTNDNGTVTGYARSIVRRSGGINTNFGKVIGLDTNGTVASYSSGSENQIYNGRVGTTVLTGTNGRDGTSVTVDDTTTEAMFPDLFSAVLSEWTWVADGKWPAINIGEVKLASEQPIEAGDGVIASVDFEGRLNYEQEEYEIGLGIGGAIKPDSTPRKLGFDDRNVSIDYILTRNTGTTGTVFDPEPAIDGEGVITIASETNEGTASYTVQASADDYGYNIQDETLTITVKNVGLEGTLDYPETEYEFTAGIEDIIIPDSTPAIPNFDTRVVSIRYSISIAIDSEMEFDPAPVIKDSGIITIKPISTVGEAIYIVRASADGYPDQEVTLPITIVENLNIGKIQVSTYYSNVGETTDLLPVALGQAVADVGMSSMSDGITILTLSNLTNGDHLIHFGTASGNYTESYPKIASANTITILRSELRENSFVFVDGAVIGISGPNITDTQRVATYRPSNIYTYQELQAMGKNLGQAYILKNDIIFPPPSGTDTSNYEAVGDNDTPFTGSLDGAGYAIVGIEIVSIEILNEEGIEIEGADNYLGLFGVMKASSINTVIARNLVLRDFKITGNAYVGSLAGWVKKGTIDNVHVEVSSADTGKVEVSGSIDVSGTLYGYGGGLLGRAGTGAGDPEVRIQNASSVVAVSGTGENSNRIGGLVGHVGSGAMVTESHATGSVIGSNRHVGGLVGYNTGTVTGYATGSVIGENDVGGLVGSNHGTAIGYATGSVSINFSSGVFTLGVGGLVGYNIGTTVGYATGPVSGPSNIGGLVGWNDGTATGYATGTVRGNNNVGGLVGYIDRGTLIGYAHGAVQRAAGGRPNFGKTIGISYGGRKQTYSSADVPTVAASRGEEFNGIEVSIASATEATFDGLDFGTDIGQWTWFEAGKWPAINIGDEIKPAAEQPLTSMP